MCEAYLGIWPCMEVFGMFFYLHAQTTDGKQRDCSSVSIYTKNTPLPKIQLPDSIKKWQSTYFYVRNRTEVDRVGLPAFSDALPALKSWNRKPLIDGALEEVLMGRLKELVDVGLTSRDLTLAWLSRRTFLLRAGSHKMCFYSGPRDPTHVSMEAAPLDSLRQWMARVITDKVGRNWRFGFRPFTRSERAPEVSCSCSFACLRSLLPVAV